MTYTAADGGKEYLLHIRMEEERYVTGQKWLLNVEIFLIQTTAVNNNNNNPHCNHKRR